MISMLLDTPGRDQIITEPFPHLIIHQAIDENLSRQLIKEFPAIHTIAKGVSFQSNERFSYTAIDALKDSDVSPVWKKFVLSHISQMFLDQVVNLFADCIKKLYPHFEDKIYPANQLKAGIREKDTFFTSDVLLDAQICVNTPVINQPSSVRRGHVDLPDKLFAGLFYLRDADDNSTGGDLEIYRYRNQRGGFKGQFIEDKYIELVKTIKYESNVLVLFLNSVDSIHAVSERSVTNFPRCFFNLVGEVNHQLFNLDNYQENRLKKFFEMSPQTMRKRRAKQ